MAKWVFIIYIFSISHVFSQMADRVMVGEVSKNFEIKNWKVLKARIQEHNTQMIHKGVFMDKASGRVMFSSYADKKITDMNLYLETLYFSYFDESDYAINSVLGFLENQKENGYIPATLYKNNVPCFKPFLAQIAFIASKQIRDYSWMSIKSNSKNNYQKLQAYMDYWFNNMDNDDNGFPAWEKNEDGIVVEGVDLASYLYRELETMAILAHLMNELEDEKRYKEQAKELIQKINDHFWNEEEGYYYSKNEKTGEFIRKKTIEGFMPLFANVATRKASERIVNDIIISKNAFSKQFIFSIEQGSINIIDNYLLSHALQDYGFKELAKTLAEKTYKMVYKENKALGENYNIKDGKAISKNNSYMVSAMGYFFPWEWQLNYNPTSLHWQPILPIAKVYMNMELPQTTISN